MTPAKRPTIKGDYIDRAPVAQTVLEDPQYVAVRPGSEYVVAWARIGDEQAHTIQGYRPVRPEEVEEMPAGTYTPEKDFGAWFYFERDADRIRQGDSILMKIPRAMRDRRVAKEQERAQVLAPPRDRSMEQANYELGDTVSLKDEMKQ